VFSGLDEKNLTKTREKVFIYSSCAKLQVLILDARKREAQLLLDQDTTSSHTSSADRKSQRSC
jgi:hypothetical protein